MAVCDNQTLFQKIKELGVVKAEDLDRALIISNENKQFLGDVIYQHDLLTDEQVGHIVADILKLPFVILTQLSIPKEVFEIIPEVYSRKQEIVVFKKDPFGLYLATSNPDNQTAFEFISRKTGQTLILHYATARDIKSSIDSITVGQGTGFDETIKRILNQVETNTDNDTPIIGLVDTILNYSQRNRSSDVHFEPQENRAIIRCRIDGILHDIAEIPISVHPLVVTRIKVLSRLRTDEHNAVQDGKFQFVVEEEKIDVRVSITPVVNGEKAVLRLLSSQSRQYTLSNLGISQSDLERISSSYKKPYGMILSTGPTGSGKTTTLYTILKPLNTRKVNIMTIEDPVEYEVEGINQIQVNPQTNLTFADGLKSIVRQDPNIILVGEIRDQETAQIAVNAAMTGHLVLSTLHTNDAATTIPRLFDMGIEPFLIGSSVNCIIAQRLVRKICLKCRTSKEVSLTELADLGIDQVVAKKVFGTNKQCRIYYGKGCQVCHQTGFVGRVGIFEVMLIDQGIREAIVARSDSDTIYKLAAKSGMTTMLEDGLNKVSQGQTTVEEIIRVTKI